MDSPSLLVHPRAGANPRTDAHADPAAGTGTGANESTWQVSITPENAGWGYSGLKVAQLAEGSPLEFATVDDEALILPLSGACEVSVAGRTWALTGRANVFSALTDYLYLPRNTVATLKLDEAATPGPAEIAITTARAQADFPIRYFDPSQVTASLRGSGNCTREVRNYALGNGVETDRLLVVEVITPAGNFSSYPPHKHDEHSDVERVLEEIYYYRFNPESGTGFHHQYESAPPHAADLPKTSSPAASPTPERTADSVDLLAQVSHGDTVLVPRGFHGPCVALPGGDMYYLNVMAGPARDGQWLMSDDPDYSFVRELWQDSAPDPRLPMAKEH